MPQPSEAEVRAALAQVRYPGFSRDIVSFGLVKEVRVEGGNVTVQLTLATNDARVPQQIKEEGEAVVRQIAGVEQARLLIDIQAPPQAAGGVGGGTAQITTAIEGVRHIIAVASGKGGVGKSTVAANLAVALAATGASVGLCDCDMYGPSMGVMFGSAERPMQDQETGKIIPVERHGVRLMSMGFLLDDASPAILRGPMVTKYTQQFLRQVEWGELDVLILDLPPGTGDIQLTIVQTVAVDGALVVTTPQEVALIDARKAAAMFGKVNVPVIGIIENMSYFLSPSDGVRYDIFGTGGGEREAERLGVPLLAQIPIDMAAREAGDRGLPVAAADPTSPAAQEFRQVANRLASAITP